MSIYVEAEIHGTMEDLWRKTQDPQQHQQWDLRFTSIDYLPRDGESARQRFRYATRIGFGLQIQGEGESIADREGSSGERTSSLRFWSADPKSLIREGAGYWQYKPLGDRVRFITDYDYQVRFGRAGRLVDRLTFRPLLRWATAWSFDCLRLWVEKGVHPSNALNRLLTHCVARFSISLVWLYHGIVPKLLARHADETAMLMDAGLPAQLAPSAVAIFGWLELVWGMFLLVFHRSRWPLAGTVLAMLTALVLVSVHSPRYLTAAFNPVSLNLLVAAMCLVDWLSMRDLPSAANCRLVKEER